MSRANILAAAAARREEAFLCLYTSTARVGPFLVRDLVDPPDAKTAPEAPTVDLASTPARGLLAELAERCHPFRLSVQALQGDTYAILAHL